MTATEQQPRQNPTRPPGRSRRLTKRLVVRTALALGALLVLAQFVPYGHSWVPFGHPSGNPPVTKAAVWPNPEAQAIAEWACYDCHSNLTSWWLGTKVAPASWLAQSDVSGGREALDFSEWDKPQPSLDDVVESIGGMPPIQYWLIHPKAHLGAQDQQRLIAGLRELYATDPPAGTKQGGGG